MSKILPEKVQQAIDDFKTIAGRFETPKGACGNCQEASFQFCDFGKEIGLKCYAMQVEAFKGDPDGVEMNRQGMRQAEVKFQRRIEASVFRKMNDFIDPKDFVHNINLVKEGERLFFIDWTARQFDEKADFPAVFTKDEMMEQWEKSNEDKILAIALD